MRVLLSIIVVLLVGIAALLGVQTFNHPPDRWSYAIISPDDKDLTRELNRAGAEGWEVVSARRATSLTFALQVAVARFAGMEGVQAFSFQKHGTPYRL